MNQPNDVDGSVQVSESIEAFEMRAQRILEQLNRADKILDNLQTKQKKTDTAIEVFEELFDSIERGMRKLFSTPLSQIVQPVEKQKAQRRLTAEELVYHLRSYSDEELTAIKRKIDSILKERGSM